VHSGDGRGKWLWNQRKKVEMFVKWGGDGKQESGSRKQEWPGKSGVSEADPAIRNLSYIRTTRS